MSTQQDPTVMKLVDQWREWDQNKDSLAEISSLVTNNEWEKLTKIMMKRLEFGTAGIRGRMGPGFGQMNDLVIIQVTQGLHAYLAQDCPDLVTRGVVLGYDGRHNSCRWAGLASGVFLRAGVPVYMFPTTVPTPYVPFTILEKGAAAGVMVTASHNPKWDNGYKVYWGNGAQILSPHDKNIQAAILKNLIPHPDAFTVPDPSNPLLKNVYEEIHSLYASKLPRHHTEAENNQLSNSIVYTAMHGVGHPYVLQSWLTAGFPRDKLLVVTEQRDPDPEFSTVDFPNPEEGASALDLSFQLANKSGSSYILANDPDADRLGVAQKLRDGSWKILSGNEIGALLGWWLLRCYKERNKEVPLSKLHFLASTVSSKILNTIAKKEGINFTETLTGFKHMGNKSNELLKAGEVVLFAYEEAIGFMCGTNVLDKDGVSASVVVTELIRHLETRDLLLTDQLESLYTTYGYHYSLNSYYLCYDPATTDKIFNRIRNYQSATNQSYPASFCGGKYRVSGVRDLTTGYDNTREDGVASLPVSRSSHMITLWLDNGVVITLRTSGTEPKLKYYTEFCAPPENKDWAGLERELGDIVTEVIQDLFQPEINGLKAKPV